MKKITVENVGGHPIKFLRVLRGATGMSLKASVSLRNSLPGLLFDGVPDEVAKQLKEKFEKIGTKIRLAGTENQTLMVRFPQELKT